jgi:hypothetical protein
MFGVVVPFCVMETALLSPIIFAVILCPAKDGDP